MRASTSAIYAWAEDLRKRMLQEYQVLLEAEYDAALTATEGVMVRRGSQLAGWRSWEVFRGNPVTVQTHATEELYLYLQTHPRTTRTEFEREWLSRYLGGEDESSWT